MPPFSEFSPEFVEENGTVYLNNERVLITSSRVFGILRKELFDNISEERMRGFLLRYGGNLRKNDAQQIRKKLLNEKSLDEILSQGPVLHMMKGIYESSPY